MMNDLVRDLIEDVRTVYKGKGMSVYPDSFDRLRTEIIKLDNINKQQSEKIEKLEEENAELKKQQFSLRKERNTFLAQNEQYEKDLIDFNENLTKAKEVIKGLLCILYDKAEEELNSGDKDIIHKAEEFLKKE